VSTQQLVESRPAEVQAGDGSMVAAWEDDEDDRGADPFPSVPAPLESAVLDEVFPCGPSKCV